MTTAQIESMMGIADNAKAIGYYPIANAITAVLLDECLGSRRYPQEDDPSPPITIEWETQDEDGWYPHEVYYDLVVLRHGDKSLCIPVPLLNSFVAITALKAATRRDRAEHRREVEEPREGEVAGLWVGLGEIIPIADLHRLVGEYLDKAQSADLFRDAPLPQD